VLMLFMLLVVVVIMVVVQSLLWVSSSSKCVVLVVLVYGLRVSNVVLLLLSWSLSFIIIMAVVVAVGLRSVDRNNGPGVNFLLFRMPPLLLQSSS